MRSRRSLCHALHLQAAERICGAGWARPQMALEARAFFLRSLVIDIGVQLAAPNVTYHLARLAISRPAFRAWLFAHEKGATSPYPSESPASRRFPGSSSPPDHTTE